MNEDTTVKCPFEHASSEENNHINELDEITVALINKRYPDGVNKLRAVHPKSHGCIEAKFKVNEDLNTEYRVGLFSDPGKEFKAKVRYSNAAPKVEPDIVDGQHGSRGMAIKILNVGGEVILQDNQAHNQDFLMINQSRFAFANSEDYLVLNKVLLNHNDNPLPYFEGLEALLIKAAKAPHELTQLEQHKIETAKIIKQIKSTPVAHPLQVQYFGAAPFLFGANKVMRFTVKPISNKDSKLPENPKDNYLREALHDTMKEGQDIAFSFQIQLRKCSDDLGIENAQSEWDESKFPFEEVAQITIPNPQETLSEENIIPCEKLAFNPWHSLIEHRPIGSINRLRKSVYLSSSFQRNINL